VRIKSIEFHPEVVHGMTLDEFLKVYGNALRKDKLDCKKTYKQLKGGSKIAKKKKFKLED
jgi:hypothetical protein